MDSITVRFFTTVGAFQFFKDRAVALGMEIKKEDEEDGILFIQVPARNIREATSIVYDALEER